MPEGEAEASAEEPVPSTRRAVDEQRVFRQICWLGGLSIALSITYAVVLRVFGASALDDTLASGATALIALGGAFTAPKLVRAALRLPSARDWLTTLLVALLVGPTVAGAFWVMGRLGFQIWNDYLDPYANDGWPIWEGYVSTAIVTPIGEEVLFRGVIQPKLGQLIKANDALIVQAALFSALHLSPLILVTHFVLGLAFGWIRQRSGSLLPSILLHAIWNAWVLWSSV